MAENNLNSLEDSSDEYLTHHDVELYLKKNPEFTKKFVFNYLSNHLDFADEFFQAWYDNMIGLSLKRGGSGSGGRSKSPASGGVGIHGGNFATSHSDDSAFFAEEDEEDENEIEDNDVYHHSRHRHHHNSHQHSSTITIGIGQKNTGPRRLSDPITNTISCTTTINNNNNITTSSSNNNTTNKNVINGDINKKLVGRSGSEECLDTIDEDVVTRTGRSSSMVLPKEAKYRAMSVDSNNNKHLGASIESLLLKSNTTANATNITASTRTTTGANKPHLRKAQSAPTYKKKLSNLIRSSVFSGSSNNSGSTSGTSNGSKHINVENHTALRELNESHYIVEIIKDISKDMSLTKVCFKILVNLGFLLNIEKASIFIVHEQSSSSSINTNTNNNNNNNNNNTTSNTNNNNNSSSSNNKDNKKSLKLLLDSVSIAKGVRKESLSSSLSKQPQVVPIGSGIIGHVAESGESLVVNSISSVSIF